MSAPRGPRPPRIAERLLRSLLPADGHGRAILGDLHEEFEALAGSRGTLRAHLWYWRQLAGLGLGYARPGSGIFDHVRQDVRQAARGLAREPGFTLTVLVTLALGIGAGTAIFSVVDAVLLRPLPYDRPHELVRVWASDGQRGEPYVDLHYGDVARLRDGVPAFSRVAGLSLARRTLLDAIGDNAEDVRVARTTPELFPTLGIVPVVGRAYTADDVARGERIALVSHELWQRRFGGDPSVVGVFVHLDVRGYEIIGVLPHEGAYPEGVDVWRPLLPDEMEDEDREVHVVARLEGDADATTANAQVRALAAALAERNPDTHGGMSAWVQPLQAMLVRDVRAALTALLGAVALVLLITCVNTANLLLARAANRRHEVAIRAALGAGRGRIAGYHVVESLLLTLLGTAAGLLAARWILAAILAVTPRFPRLDAVALDVRVIAFIAGVMAVAGLLFGVVPASQAAGTAPQDALRDGGRAATDSGGRLQLQSGLVTTEIALSTVLAVLALVSFSAFRTVLEHDRGFAFDGLVAVYVNPMHPPVDGDETRAYYQAMLERVGRIDGVRGVALSSHEVMEPGGFGLDARVLGAPRSEEDERASLRSVDGAFFATVGLPLRAGRIFEGEAGSDDDLELVVNERFARTFVPAGTDPVGARIDADWLQGTVVGVVGDVSPALGEPARPLVYASFERLSLPRLWLLARTTGEEAAVIAETRRGVKEVDRAVLVERGVVFESEVRTAVAPERFNMLLAAAFAALALALAGVGIYGLTAYTVTRRRAEIGIRRALGASGGRVASEVARRIGRLTVAGVLLGITGAIGAERLLSSLVLGAGPTDPFVLGGVAILLGAVAAAAAVVPVRRAVRIDPTEALRG